MNEGRPGGRSVTVPSTGSIAIAHVQEWPCGVTDDCLLFQPKKDVPHAMLYIAAAAIREERWRASYGRKATPGRIAHFPLPHSDDLLERVNTYLERAAKVEDQMLVGNGGAKLCHGSGVMVALRAE